MEEIVGIIHLSIDNIVTSYDISFYWWDFNWWWSL